MRAYRVYFVGRNNHFYWGCDMTFANDVEAIAEVSLIPHSGPLELWERDRFVKRFDPAYGMTLPTLEDEV